LTALVHNGLEKTVKRRFVITRRRLLRAAAATAGLGAVAGLYTWLVEPTWLQVVERPLPLSGLPEQLAGARLVQLSDLHIGLQVDDAYLLEVFQRVKDLAPEIVVYTGDLTSYHRDVTAQARRMFAELPLGSQATFGILGNHDYGPGWADLDHARRIADLAASAGVQILRNEVGEAGGLQVVGLDDLWARRFAPSRPMSALDSTRAAVVLSHNPDTADEPGWNGYSGWILAGHTHGGQCKPPFLPPPVLPVRNRRYTSGEFALSGGRRMYINRGVGHLLRVRFNARPEVTVFRLENALDKADRVGLSSRPVLG
jgi:predicted MPP superfamily phosphohydrolase